MQAVSLEHSPVRQRRAKVAGGGVYVGEEPADPRPALLVDYLTRAELARELGCSERTIARYGVLPDGLPYLFIGGRKRYRISAVRDWLARREHHPNPVRRGRK